MMLAFRIGWLLWGIGWLSTTASAHTLTPVSLYRQPTAKGVVLLTFARTGNDQYKVTFDTGGQTIGGFSQAQLNEKFTRVLSAAEVINFVLSQGYRVVSLVPRVAGAGAGTGGGTSGYVVLLEQS